MKETKKILSIFLCLLMVSQLFFPLIATANDTDDDVSIDINLSYNRDANIINVSATDTASDIVSLKYTHKSISLEERNYFEEDHDDVFTLDISNQSDAKKIETSFNFMGYGDYTVYGKNNNGEIFLSRITIPDPNDVPTLKVEKDKENPLHINITATSNASTITKIKIAKIESTERIDFSTTGTSIEFEPSNNVTTKYEGVTEEGYYQIYVEDANGNSSRYSIYLGEGTSISTTDPVKGENNVFTFTATDKFFNIKEVKVAKLSELSDPKDVKTQGTLLNDTELVKNGKSATINYQPAEEGTYIFYIANEIGLGLYTEKTFKFTEENIPSDLNLKVEADTEKWTNDYVTLKISVSCQNPGLHSISVNDKYINLENGKTEYEYQASENGTYTVIARDVDGNTKQKQIVINKIDKTGPTLVVTGNPVEETNENVILNIKSTDELSGLKNVTVNGQEITLGENNSANYTVSENGTYTIVATDNVGNQNSKVIEVKQINKTPSETFMRGDVNDDGIINIQDVLALRRYLAAQNEKIKEKHPDWANLSDNQKKAADVDGKNGINIQDVLALRRYLAAQNEKIKEKHPEWAKL